MGGGVCGIGQPDFEVSDLGGDGFDDDVSAGVWGSQLIDAATIVDEAGGGTIGFGGKESVIVEADVGIALPGDDPFADTTDVWNRP